jgi:protein-tyrosine phosphatase
MNVNYVLFICTVNYYRSRFAEAVFNQLASREQINWHAFSRGLAIDTAPDDDISISTRDALACRGIPIHQTAARKTSITENDMRKATVRIALKEAEHRPLIQALLPAWDDKIVYWHIHDVDVAPPHKTIPLLEAKVIDLINELKQTTAVDIPASSSWPAASF